MKQLFLLWLTMAVFSGAVAAHMNDYPEQSVKSSSPVYHFNLQAGNSQMTEDVKNGRPRPTLIQSGRGSRLQRNRNLRP